MELDVLHLDRLSPCVATRAFEHDFVVQAEAELRHAGKVALHLDGTKNLGANNISVCVYLGETVCERSSCSYE